MPTAFSGKPSVYVSAHASTYDAGVDLEKAQATVVIGSIVLMLSALFGLPNPLAELSDAQLRDTGIPPERAGRGRAAYVDAATIANLNSMR